MSMTAEQRKEWAYGILDRWTKDQEAGEMLDLLEEILSKQDDIHDLHASLTELGREVDDLDTDVSRLVLQVEDVESRVSDLEGWQEEQAA